jgi:exodeoxyribonuclease-3
MKIVSWNVNSVRARLDRVLAFLDRVQPDVLCLQELKTEASKFPSLEFKAHGYDAAVLGQKTYNGVAILSRKPMSQISEGLADGGDDTQARLISAVVDGVHIWNVYMPNGAAVPSDKFDYKLDWMTRLRTKLGKVDLAKTPLLLCGDFNVAPEDIDVHSTKLFANEPIFHPLAKASLVQLKALGFEDVFRKHVTGPGHYTWWDYRAGGWKKNLGLRIDHLYATALLAARSVSAEVDKPSRDGDQPSDHAALVGVFK